MNEKISINILAIIMVAAFIILMIPLIYIGKYDKPVADDYGYAVWTHHTWDATHSVGTTLSSVIERVKVSYDTWQGTFSSIFMMALSPAAFAYWLYKLVPAIMVFMLSLACFVIAKTILKNYLKADNAYWMIVGSALSILTIEKMHSSPSGLYWYNAAVHYTFMHACMILMIAMVLRAVQAKKVFVKSAFTLLATLFAVASGGSNYATSLMGFVCLISLLIVLFIFFKKAAFIGLIPLFTYAVCFILNITAPGNSVRQSNYQGYSALQSILLSFKSAFLYSVEWTDIFTLLMLLLLIPVFWNCLEKVKFRFPMPGLVLLYTFCVLATGFTSSYYSMGTEGLSRLHNVIKITFQIFLLLNEAYFIGWLRHILAQKQANKKQETVLKSLPVYLLSFILIVIAMYGTVHFAKNQAGTFTTYAAVYFIKTGEAPMYYQEYMARKMTLERSSETDIELEPYQYRPWLLYIDDITEDPNDWRNVMVSDWYGKSSVKLKSQN